jgi:hypothetical protein
MLPWNGPLAGRIDELVIDSTVLRGNPLGDPHERPLWVYTPPGYDDDTDRRYPTVYEIQGYTGHLTMWRNRSAFRQPFVETADHVFASGSAPPAIVVYVDAWTAYGGSQFVDSPGTGRYHTYLCDEVVPFVDARYRTLDAARHRGIQGKSSGGFGAFITPMLRPDLFGGLASHAGDALYEFCYLREFADSVRYLRDYDGDVWKWWDDFRSRVAFTKKEDATLLMTLRGLLLRRRRRHGAAPVRPEDRATDPVALGPLAGLGPGADGAEVRRRAARPDRRVDRRRYVGRVVPRHRRRGGGRRAGEDRGDRRAVRAVRGDTWRDRVPLPARARLPRGKVVRDLSGAADFVVPVL